MSRKKTLWSVGKFGNDMIVKCDDFPFDSSLHNIPQYPTLTSYFQLPNRGNMTLLPASITWIIGLTFFSDCGEILWKAPAIEFPLALWSIALLHRVIYA